jgi:hypothetical protein
MNPTYKQGLFFSGIITVLYSTAEKKIEKKTTQSKANIKFQQSFRVLLDAFECQFFAAVSLSQ